MNSFSHSYDPSSRILSIKEESTGKTVFVPKTLDGTPENWQVKTQNGQTLISYTVGGESIQHTIQGNEYRTLIGSNTVPPDFRACWEKELKSNGTFKDANVCKAENFNVAPSTPPSKPETPPAPPASGQNKPPQPKPDTTTPPAPTTPPSVPVVPSPAVEILRPSEKAAAQRAKEEATKTTSKPSVVPTATTEILRPSEKAANQRAKEEAAKKAKETPVAPTAETEKLTPSEKAAAQRAKEEATKTTSKPSVVPTATTEILTPSEKALVQREKEKQAKEVYGPPTPTAEEWEKHRKTNPSPKSTPVVPSTPSNPTGTPNVEVGKSFPPELPPEKQYRYEKKRNPDGTYTLSLKQGDNTILYERPFGETSSTDPLTQPIYRNNTGWITTSNKDKELTSTIKLHPEAKHWNGSPRVEVTEQEEGKPGKTIKKSNWRGQLEIVQTAEEGELKALEEKIANKKESIAQYEEQLAKAKKDNDPTAIQEAKQNIGWEQNALSELLKKQKELEAAIEAEKKGNSK